MNSFVAAGEAGSDQPEQAATPLDLRVVDTAEGLVVQPVGELDVDSAPRFLDALRDTLPAGRARDVALDLSSLAFLDVTGVRALISVHDLVTTSGGRLKVRGLDGSRLPVARVLDLGRYLEAGPDETQ